MKTVVEIPDREIEAAKQLTGAGTPEEAVARAVAEFVHDREERSRIARELYGSIPDVITQEELRRARQES